MFPHRFVRKAVSGSIRFGAAAAFAIWIASSLPAQLSIGADGPDAETTARFERVVREADWGGGTLSILIHDPARARTLFEQRADFPVCPGALTRLVTAAAALDRLGPEFRFSTELILPASAERDARSIPAILLRGSGDPSLSPRYLETREALLAPFDRWARVLRERGIRRIDGPVVADDLAFDDHWFAPGWPMDRDGDPSLPGIGALNFNDNCLEIDWRVGGWFRRRARFEVFPGLPGDLRVFGNVRVVDAPLGSRRARRIETGNLIVVTGDIAPGERPTDRAAVGDPGLFAADVFRRRLIAAGIKVKGPAATLRTLPADGAPAADGTPLAVRFSPPLPEMLARMKRDEGILEAETIFKALGRRSDGDAPTAAGNVGTFASGARAVQGYLESIRLPGPFFAIVDGSGRSEMNRLSPRQIVYLMQRARSDPRTGRMFDEVLPPADAPRNPAGGATPLLWMQTDAGVGFQAAAGRVQTRDGRSVLFALVVNESRLPPPQLRAQIERLLNELTR